MPGTKGGNVAAAALLALGLSAACATRRPPPPGAGGSEIYRLQLCANCHGEAREGTRRGPPLSGLAPHWSAARLAEYLLDPQAVVARDPRLAELDEVYGRGFFGSQMGPYDNLDEEQRTTLAEWLLVDPVRP